MPVYMAFLKVEPKKAKEAMKELKELPEYKQPNLKIFYVANVFGEWDNCVWFEVENHEHAMDFVQNELAKIPGIAKTYTLPTTPIKEYFKRWK